MYRGVLEMFLWYVKGKRTFSISKLIYLLVYQPGYSKRRYETYTCARAQSPASHQQTTNRQSNIPN